jgi:hypothetical protein
MLGKNKGGSGESQRKEEIKKEKTQGVRKGA